jgi:hypothetical protein
VPKIGTFEQQRFIGNLCNRVSADNHNHIFAYSFTASINEIALPRSLGCRS